MPEDIQRELFVVHTLSEELIVEPPAQAGASACFALTMRHSALKFLPRARETLSDQTRMLQCHALLGIVSLLRGAYLVVVVDAAHMGDIHAVFPVYNVRQVELLPIPRTHPPRLTPQDLAKEREYLELIHQVVAERALYFSPRKDLTSALGLGLGLHDADKFDPRFCWNAHMMEAFLANGYGSSVERVMSGFVEITNKMSIGRTTFRHVLVSRRGIGRQGTRFNVRGVDAKGCVANFIETEQLVFPLGAMAAEIRCCSFIQTRGSIPVQWAQVATLKYMPRVELGSDKHKRRGWFRRHFGEGGEHALDLYGHVVSVNLIDKVGKSGKVRDQRMLGEAFAEEVEHLRDDRLKHVWFDFHHECRKMRWENLSKLMDIVMQDLQSFGYGIQATSGEWTQRQKGVIRTNCMDNLDRTNVVQSLFARAVLLAQIKAIEAGRPEAVKEAPLESAHAEFEKAFKNVWANNADAMSLLYSGTPALKTDFTRTGRRTKLGAIKDGINSVTRYYLNNFCDGHRQDAVDLFLGKVDVHTVSEPKAVVALSPQAMLARVGFVYGQVLLTVTICSALTLSQDLSLHSKLTLSLWISLTVAVVLIQRMLSKGFNPKLTEPYVSKPSLIPLPSL